MKVKRVGDNLHVTVDDQLVLELNNFYRDASPGNPSFFDINSSADGSISISQSTSPLQALDDGYLMYSETPDALSLPMMDMALLPGIGGALLVAGAASSGMQSSKSKKTVQAITTISDAAQGNTASPTTTSVDTYTAAGIKGVTADNLAAVNAQLNSAATDGAATGTPEKIQAIVNAVNAVKGGAAGGTPVSEAQLETLGVKGVTPANLAEVQKAIAATPDDGTGVDTIEELQAVVNAGIVAAAKPVQADPMQEQSKEGAIDAIQFAAQSNTASPTTPSIDTYIVAGIKGVTADNLAAVNAQLNSPATDGPAANTPEKIQAIVNGVIAIKEKIDAIEAIKNAAQGDTASPTTTSLDTYVDAGIKGVTADNLAAVNAQLNSPATNGTAADTPEKIQAVVNGVIAAKAIDVIQHAAQGDTASPATTSVQTYADAGIKGVTADNLAAVNAQLNSPATDGPAANTPEKIQAIVDGAIAIKEKTDAIEAIKNAAQGDTASPATTSLDTYVDAGIKGVTADNLAAVNAQLNSPATNGAAADTPEKIQAVVNGVIAAKAIDVIQHAAQGDTASPATTSVQTYADAGIKGVTADNLAAVNAQLNSPATDGPAANTPEKIQAIVNGAIAIKEKTDAIEAIKNAAQGDTASPATTSLDTYVDAGIKGVTADNLAAVNAQLNSPATNGAAADTPEKIQAVVNGVIAAKAIDVIQHAAQGDTASPATTSVQTYADAGIKGVTADNLAAVNAQLNSPATDGSAANTPEKIQAIVDGAIAAKEKTDAIEAIKNAAQGDTASPTTTSVDTYADAGIKGVTADNLAAVNAQLNSPATDGSAANTPEKIQAIVDGAIAAKEKTDAIEAIKNAAQGDTASPTTTSVDTYADAGIKGVTADNLAAVNAQLNSPGTDATAANTPEKIQAIVNGVIAAKAIDIIQHAAQGDTASPTTTSVDTYADAGIKGVTADNLAAVNAQLNSPGTDATAANTPEKIQAIVNGVIADKAIDAIQHAAQGDTASPTTTSVQTYADAGIRGVTADNLAAVNAQLNSPATNGAAADTPEKIQAIVNGVIAAKAIDVIQHAAQGDTASPTTTSVQTYADAGIKGVTADNLAAVNAQLNNPATDATAANTPEKIQAIVDGVNAAKAITAIQHAAQGDTASPTTTSVHTYADAGIKGVTADNLAAVNAQLNDPATNGAAADTPEKIQAIVNGVLADKAIDAIQHAAQGDTASPTTTSVQTYADAGIKGVTADNLAAVNAQLNSPGTDATAANTPEKIQAIVDGAIAIKEKTDAIEAIKNAAQGDTASPTTTSVDTYADAGIKGVTADNLAAVNAQLNSPATNGAAANTPDKIQAIVNGVIAAKAIDIIQHAAQGDTASPTTTSVQTFADAGIKGVTAENLAAVNAQLNSPGTDATAANTPEKIQAIVNGVIAHKAIDAIQHAAQGDTASPTTTSVQTYADAGIKGVTAENLAAVNAQLNSPETNSAAADTPEKIQAIVNGVIADKAIDVIQHAAQGDTASPTTTSVQTYADAGIKGVTADNLAAVNAQLNSPGTDGSAANTPEKIQAIVDGAIAAKEKTDAIEAIKNAAQGDTASPTTTSVQTYADAGIKGVTADNLTAVNAQLNSPGTDATAANTPEKIQVIVNGVIADKAIDAIQHAAQGDTASPTTTSVQTYADAGIKGVTADNLAAVNAQLNSPATNSAAADTPEKIQAIVDGVIADKAKVDAIDAIHDAAEDNTASETTPSVETYASAGVNGVTSANLAALNEALNSGAITGAAADTPEKIQAIVDSLKESQPIRDALKAISDAAQADTASPSTTSVDTYAVAGVQGVTADNLAAVNALLNNAAIDGPAANTAAKIQAIVNGAIAAKVKTDAVDTIQHAAQDNTASATTPSLETYANAGVRGVTSANLAALNEALNSTAINGAATDTPAKIQSIVDSLKESQPIKDALKAINDAAQGNTASPTTTSVDTYANAGIKGVTEDNLAAVNALLNSALIDGPAVNTAAKIQSIVDGAIAAKAKTDAIEAIKNAAQDNTASPTTTSVDTYANAGIEGVTADNLAAVNALLNNAAIDGAAASTPEKIQALVDGAITTTAIDAIRNAAQGNTASPTTPSEDTYAAAGVVGVTSANLAAVNALLNNAVIDGAATDTPAKIQAIVNDIVAVEAKSDAIEAIKNAAQNDTASATTTGVDTYAAGGIKGVTSDNLAAVNALLNSAAINGAAADTPEKIQALVDGAVVAKAKSDAIEAIQDAAQDNTASATTPSVSTYTAAGVTGVSGDNLEAVNSVLNSIAVNSPATDTAAKIQAIVDNVQVVKAAAAGGTPPTLAQLEGLGITDVTPLNLAALQAAIAATADDGSGVNTLAKLQGLATAGQEAAEANAIKAISDAAQANNASPSTASAALYAAAGVEGVSGDNLEALNSVLNGAVDGPATDTAAKIQAIVDNLQVVKAAAAGGTPPTEAQLKTLGITDVTPANLAALQAAIAATADDGTGVNTLEKLQAVVHAGVAQAAVDAAKAAQVILDALNAIKDAAQGDNATATTPSQETYAKAGINGVTKDNLAALNVALNTAAVDGAATDTPEKIQAIVDNLPESQPIKEALKAISDAAQANTATNGTPTAATYDTAGVNGVTRDNVEAVNNVLNGAVDGPATDTAAKIQVIVDNLQVVKAAANGGTPPTEAQLKTLGITGVTPANLAAVQAAIAATADDGSGVNTLAKLQGAVAAGQEAAVANAVKAISDAAQANNASPRTASAAMYDTAGVTGVSGDNLAAINSVLNGGVVDGPATDTVAKIQAIVDNLQVVKAAAAGGTPPTAAQLRALGITNVTPANLEAVQKAIEATANDGSGVNTLAKLQGLVAAGQATAMVSAVTAISDAAQANNASPSTAGEVLYTAAGVTGVRGDNLDAVNDALNSPLIDGPRTDTRPKIQTIVNAVNAVKAAAAGGTPPTRQQLETLGITGVSDANLAAVQAAINATEDSGAGVDRIAELQGVVSMAVAINAISVAAQSNNAVPAMQNQAMYSAAGVTGVTQDNLAAVNNALNSTPINGAATNTAAKIQAIVDAVQAVKTAAADGAPPTLEQLQALGIPGVTLANLKAVQAAIAATRNDGGSVDTIPELLSVVSTAIAIKSISDAAEDNNASPTTVNQEMYANAGIQLPLTNGILSAVNDALNNLPIDGEATNTQPKIRAIVQAVNAVLTSAAGTTPPTLAQLNALGIDGMKPENLAAVQAAIAATADDGTEVNTIAKLQGVATAAQAAAVDSAVKAISDAAQANNASPRTASLALYKAAGVEDVSNDNLEAVNSVLNGAVVDGPATDTAAKIQAIVDNLQVVKAAAAGGTPPTEAQLKTLGITDVTPANLAALQAAIAATADDGSGVNTLAKLQGVLATGQATSAVKSISDAAQANNASPRTVSEAVYTAAGVTGVSQDNLATVNGVLNGTVNGAATDTAAKIQAIVDAVNTVMDAAAGGTPPTLAQLQTMGIPGVRPANLGVVQAAIEATADDGSAVNTFPKLRDVVSKAIAIKSISDAAQANNASAGVVPAAMYASAGVQLPATNGLLLAVNDALNSRLIDGEAANTQPEIQAIVNAFNAVLTGAAGATPPTLEQLKTLGITGVTPENLDKVQAAIAATANDGTGVNTIARLQRVAETGQLAAAVKTISDAAQDNDATLTTPSLETYANAGVKGVTSGNQEFVVDILKTQLIDRAATDTTAEIQGIVDAANAVLSGAAGGTPPTLAQLNALGITGVTAATLPAMQAAIEKTSNDGRGVDTIAELQAVINAVDVIAPTVSSVRISGSSGNLRSDTLKEGNGVQLEVTMSENVVVSGAPRLQIMVGSTVVDAVYNASASAGDPTQLIFTTSILAGQTDTNGISIGANSLSLNGGTIADATGNQAVLTHTAVADNKAYMVDTSAPVFTSGATATLKGGSISTSTIVYDAAATDPSGVTFSLGTSLDNAKFNIDSSSGVVTLKSTQTYYTAEMQKDRLLSVNITADDGIGHVSTQKVDITMKRPDSVDVWFDKEHTKAAGTLRFPVEVDAGEVYYFWDRDGNGIAGSKGDLMTTADISKYFQFGRDHSVSSPTGEGTTSLRFGSLYTAKGDMLWVALPQVGNELSISANTAVGGNPKTNGSNEASPHWDYHAIYDAYNGTGTVAGVDGTPPNWVGGNYWSSEIPLPGQHYLHNSGTGIMSNGLDKDPTSLAYVALQVL